MRGKVERQGSMFFTKQAEDFVPESHPLRAFKVRVDEELKRLRPVFDEAYSRTGRPSVPPEQLIKASLLQALYSIRSERQLCEQIGYSMLFRWFLDMKPDDEVWDPTTFTKNRERFAKHGLMEKFFHGTVAQAIKEEAASLEHFSVDGTLIQAWASTKSFRPKDESDGEGGSKPRDNNGWADFRGEKRSNKTHASKTDPEARLLRKGRGQAAQLSHSLHGMIENRNGILMDIRIAEASGKAEREEARKMLKRVRRRHGIKPETLGADKGYDDGEFLDELENEVGVTPHVAIRKGTIKGDGNGADARRRARRRQRTKSYHVSQVKRRLIEPVLGWIKDIGGLARTRFVGRWKTQLYAYGAGAAFNLMKLVRLATA